jgi:cell division protein FtsA
MSDIIAGLDVGSHAVRLAVGELVGGREKEQLHIVGAVEVPSDGVSRGTVSGIEDAISSISACLERAERVIGTPIESVWVGISGSYIASQESKGVVGVSRSDGEIREDDVERAIAAARTIVMPSNYEVLHVLPKTFTVDTQTNIKDPIGMSGIRLEVDAIMIQALSSHIKNLTKCIYRTGLNIDDIVLGILAVSEAVLTNRQKDLGVAVLNIGATHSTLAVFEGGDILKIAVLPVGSEHITSDVAIGLRTSLDIAERIKLECGTAVPGQVARRDEINLIDLGAEKEEIIMRKYVAEIIEARVEELMDKVDAELKKIGRSGMLPAGIVLTGGGSKLAGILDLVKKRLRIPASLGFSLGMTSVSDKVNDPAFATAMGLVAWGRAFGEVGGLRLGKIFGNGDFFSKISKRIKSIFHTS